MNFIINLIMVIIVCSGAIALAISAISVFIGDILIELRERYENRRQ